jgi:L-malate glycosyltransferase
VPFLVSHEQTALLVPPSDAQAMADAVLRLLDDAPLYHHLRQAGLAEVQRYTWTRIGPQLAVVYRAALAARVASCSVSPS